jgi:hypothetical protein
VASERPVSGRRQPTFRKSGGGQLSAQGIGARSQFLWFSESVGAQDSGAADCAATHVHVH